MVTTYQVKILAAGSNMSVYALIYDKSGSSYHYNTTTAPAAIGFPDIDATSRSTSRYEVRLTQHRDRRAGPHIHDHHLQRRSVHASNVT